MRTIHELRGIAQSFGVTDIFEKDVKELEQAISLAQNDMAPKKKDIAPSPIFLSMSPDHPASPEEITEALAGHIKRGLMVNLGEEYWEMSCGKKSDTGTMTMPLKTMILCADKLLT